MTRLILASGSPRRLALLAQIGVTPAATMTPDVDETPLEKETPRALAVRLARAKAEAVDADGAWVLAADTVVAVGRRILPKAENEADARDCMRLLSGRGHRVYTGIALRTASGVKSRLVETRVTFRVVTPGELDAYIAAGDWKGKAGGYAIQGHAARFISNLVGSYSSVVGLPLFETAALLDGSR